MKHGYGTTGSAHASPAAGTDKSTMSTAGMKSETDKDVAKPMMKAETGGYKAATGGKSKMGSQMPGMKREYKSISDLRVRYQELMDNEGRGTGTY